MGCGASITQGIHPSIYNETILKQKRANGEVEARPVKADNPNHLKGDYSQFQVAKHFREKQHKERSIKLFLAADEMSGKLLEEREMLSLGTRSRGTSRNTSRATSPTPTNRRSVQFKEEVQQPPMTPVVEVTSRGSFRSREDDNDDIDEQNEQVIEKQKRKQKKVKTKTKTKKKKTKTSKKTKKTKKGRREKQTEGSDDETDDDSGLEEDSFDDNKENEIIDIIATTNNIVDEQSKDRGKKKTILKRNINSVEPKDMTQEAERPRYSDITDGRGSDQHHVRVKPAHSSSKDSGIHDFDGAFASGMNNVAVSQSADRPDSRL
ncbi:uncharacterized protein LOC127837663 [Dreissena polymorpha]|uniref:uncharacterized protein LOC127837663 n=1 Tax=Dreissena polymorpha TaxID=45954 RepID=UPI002263D0EF|nr:uncharacterized protein LOC127837663 [Dreissena polymorpha]